MVINRHLTRRCNYRCVFCYARHTVDIRKELCNDLGLSYILLKELYEYFSSYGPVRITFVGGEPLLCDNLPELMSIAKRIGYRIGIVTNASLLDRLAAIAGLIDVLGVSIYSVSDEKEKILGRGYGDHVRNALKAIRLVREINPRVRIKVNTVVTKFNYDEDFYIIDEIKPDKRKVFRMLPMENVKAKHLRPRDEERKMFLEINAHRNPVIEDNDDMIDSYIMVDPEGRFISNHGLRYSFSEPILKVGVEKAFAQTNFNISKFISRYASRFGRAFAF